MSMLGKKKKSPFFQENGSPIVDPIVLNRSEILAIRRQLGFSTNKPS